MRYHAHIYFDVQSQNKAEKLFQEHLTRAKELGLWVGQLVHQKIGPHPLPMFEVHIRDSELEKYLAFLETHRAELTVLVHEDTGDDYRDHSLGARWLGVPLPLDLEFFELIKRDPSKRIHQ